MNKFQRTAVIAFVLLEVLILCGAIVRATGSGLGCPDWPTCYGCLVPPLKAAQIDFSKLDLKKFQQKAAKIGQDPSTITTDYLRAHYDPVETWIEYLNRVASLPLLVGLMAMIFASYRQPIRHLRGMSLVALGLFLMEAVIGFLVVRSLLNPNNVTIHMALAIVLLCVLVYIAWRGSEKPWTFALPSSVLVAEGSKPSTVLQPKWWQPGNWNPSDVLFMALLLFLLIVVEGIMGSQVREMTDVLAKTHAGQARSVWVGELEHTWVYLIHRSFSWVILVLGALFSLKSVPTDHRALRLQRVIIALIIAQMVLGVVLSQIGILAIAQILHITLSSLLVSALFLWLLAARRTAMK